MASKTLERSTGKEFGLQDRRGVWYAAFGSAADIVRECREATAERPDLVHFNITDASWIERKFATWDDIVAAVDGTWREGLDMVEQMAAELQREKLPQPTVIRRRRTWDDAAGDEICVDRYRAGDPFFRTMTRMPTTGPRVISLLSQLGQNAHVSSYTLGWRGALTVVLARILEDAGYRAEITAVEMGERTFIDGSYSITSVNLKAAGAALNVSSLVNVTSGWFFRTVVFGSFLTPRQPLVPNLGSMIDYVPAETVAKVCGSAKPWIIENVYDKQSALKLARRYLAQLVLDGRGKS